MMYNGWITQDLGKFLRCSLNLIKEDDKMSWDIKDFSIFGKKTPRWIYGIKNCLIWIFIRIENKEQNQGRKNQSRREKILKNLTNLLFKIEI